MFQVVGIERFNAGHDRGSSHGHTRIIRKSLMESPEYFPLVSRSYKLWRDLEEETDRVRYHKADERGPCALAQHI